MASATPCRFVAIDYFTELSVQLLIRRSSEIGAKGIFKKGTHLCAGGYRSHFRHSCIRSQNGGALRTAVIFFYLSNEGISILENAGHIGLPIPINSKLFFSSFMGMRSHHRMVMEHD